jgi:hypothetical protein
MIDFGTRGLTWSRTSVLPRVFYPLSVKFDHVADGRPAAPCAQRVFDALNDKDTVVFTSDSAATVQLPVLSLKTRSGEKDESSFTREESYRQTN